jgi:hypothetical protein
MHTWQDIVLAIGAVIFCLALIPSITGEDKPAVWTSVLTGSVLAVFTAVYVSLSLWYAALTTGLSAVLWAVLAFQKVSKK